MFAICRFVEVAPETFPPLFKITPFFFHWYDGDEPPLVGVAVKVTEVPSQILVVLGDIDTDGTTTEQAVI